MKNNRSLTNEEMIARQEKIQSLRFFFEGIETDTQSAGDFSAYWDGEAVVLSPEGEYFRYKPLDHSFKPSRPPDARCITLAEKVLVRIRGRALNCDLHQFQPTFSEGTYKGKLALLYKCQRCNCYAIVKGKDQKEFDKFIEE